MSYATLPVSVKDNRPCFDIIRLFPRKEEFFLTLEVEDMLFDLGLNQIVFALNLLKPLEFRLEELIEYLRIN